MNFMSQQQQQQHDMYSEGESSKANFRTSFYNPFEVKHRKRTSRAQFKVLEKTFLENPKPNAALRRWLAQKLSMTPRGVQVWFQNRRAKEKTQSQKKQPLVSPPSPVPSVCACADCSMTPMSRTLSLEEVTTPITPTDSQSFFFPQQQQQQQQVMYDFPMFFNDTTKQRKPTWPNMYMYSQPIPAPEFFHRLAEPIFDPTMTNIDPNFDLTF